jgi:hypothetical protein
MLGTTIDRAQHFADRFTVAEINAAEAVCYVAFATDQFDPPTTSNVGSRLASPPAFKENDAAFPWCSRMVGCVRNLWLA